MKELSSALSHLNYRVQVWNGDVVKQVASRYGATDVSLLKESKEWHNDNIAEYGSTSPQILAARHTDKQ